MSKYPKKVYVIYPFDNKGDAVGVYVGSSQDTASRIKNHRNAHTSGNTKELHELMRKNGYFCQEVDTIQNCFETHIEYDWIDFFLNRVKCRVFNEAVDLCNADCNNVPKRCSYQNALVIVKTLKIDRTFAEVFGVDV